MDKEVYRAERPLEREAKECHGCGIELEGIVMGNDGGSHGRDFSPVEYCHACMVDPDVDLIEGPGYGPVPCWPEDTPEEVKQLEDFLTQKMKEIDGTPVVQQKFRKDFGTEEEEAIERLRELGYEVTFHRSAPPDVNDDRETAFVSRKREEEGE